LRRGGWARALLAAGSIAWGAAAAADSGVEAQAVASLPRYEPQERVAGVIRIWGHGHIKLPWMKPLVMAWEKGFRRYHPGISIDDQMHGTSSGIPALFTGIGDIAILGEEILPDAAAAFEKVRHHPPLAIEILTGSLDVRNFDYAQMFFVHKDNPLARMTLAELDAIFGEEHRRGPRNIRTWGELGLKGEWADKRINPYGWKIDDSFGFYIQEAVLGGSHRWNCALREYAHIYRSDGTIYDHGHQILDALAKDRYGIAVSNVRYAGPGVKALALSANAGGPYVSASKRSLVERSYPLVRTIPAVVDRAPGEPLDPRVREFLRYVLSREGQEAVVGDGRYLPLSAEFAAEQLRKLR
jgi:phosphate transport system substrate-binding protein